MLPFAQFLYNTIYLSYIFLNIARVLPNWYRQQYSAVGMPTAPPPPPGAGAPQT